ncbi:hypothetical protein PENTCL1PPCAC_29510, partial [Pristionchus entomophagus]
QNNGSGISSGASIDDVITIDDSDDDIIDCTPDSDPLVARGETSDIRARRRKERDDMDVIMDIDTNKTNATDARIAVIQSLQFLDTMLNDPTLDQFAITLFRMEISVLIGV